MDALRIMLQPLSSTSFLIHNSLSYHSALWLPVVSLYSSQDLNKVLNTVKPEPTSLVTVHVLSELLIWLSKQLRKLKLHYRPDAYKGHFSNTVTIWP
jgi:hypothetical protein